MILTRDDLDAIEARADKGWVRPDEVRALVAEVRRLRADAEKYERGKAMYIRQAEMNAAAVIEAQAEIKRLNEEKKDWAADARLEVFDRLGTLRLCAERALNGWEEADALLEREPAPGIAEIRAVLDGTDKEDS